MFSCSWLLSVLPVTDSFSNKEIHTFSICPHQSTRETVNASLWRRKRKTSSFNDFGIVVLATHKICGAFPWRVSLFSVLWNIMFKINLSFFNQYSRIFSGILDDQRPISLPPVIVSDNSSIVFIDDTSWRSSAAAPLVKLGLLSSLRRSKSVTSTTCSSTFFPLSGSAEISPLDFTATVK